MPTSPEEHARLSVALATFQGVSFLAEQVRSIFEQDRLPFEIVFADDGSTDGTTDVIAAAIAEARSRGIRALALPARTRDGVTGNFARAFAACTGDIVIPCDQDDLWERDRLTSMGSLFGGRSDAMLMHADARLIDEDGEDLGRTLFNSLGVRRSELDGIGEGRAFEVYLHRNLVTGATMAFRRELLDLAAPFPREWLHDEWLAIVASAAREEIVVSTHATVGYRQHSANAVGAARRGIRHHLGKVLLADPGRNDLLARRARILVERLSSSERFAPDVRELARRKAAFEADRAALPPRRIQRLRAVWALDRAGGYAEFASRRRLDIVRDLLQPRRPHIP